MAKLTITSADDVEPSTDYPAPTVTVSGAASARLVSPDDYATWMLIADLEDGTTLRWTGPHGDEGLYVASGELDVDGRRCPADGAVIVESGAAATVRAVGPTRVVHVGPVDPEPPSDGLYGPPSAEGRGVHVVGPRGWWEQGGRDQEVFARWFTDSTCPTCRISFFHVCLKDPHRRDIPHTHTQDEIILVLDGSIVLGRHEHGPGTALSIPANVRYSVLTGAQGLTFLNYRPDVSVQHFAGDVKEPMLEGGEARGAREVADLVH